MADARAVFLEGNLFRHITVMALTASVGLMAVFAVDFIDMVFISMLGNAELAAAVGFAGAILFFTASFGIGMAIAAGALVARALGKGNAELAKTQAAAALVWGVVCRAQCERGCERTKGTVLAKPSLESLLKRRW
jgi:Na+-driven multidrug efflux pump